MIANVIVDVKVKNVNKPFSYLVPSYLEDVIEVGMRVKVPFGMREVMGYVISLDNDATVPQELKPISDILDITPSLTPELIDLAFTMSRDTSSFLISCIQAMLPSAIKARYEKKLVKLTTDLNEHLAPYFQNKDVINIDVIQKEDYKYVKQAIASNEVDLVYEVKDKLNVKYDTYLELIKEVDVIGTKQKQVIEELKMNGRLKKSDLIKLLKVSPQTLKSLVQKGIIKEIKEEVYRTPYADIYEERYKHKLNLDQLKSFNAIKNSIVNESGEIFLLHGVTGSGKTEVYLHVIEEVVRLGKEAIMLVPEISLTPQIVQLFKQRFGNLVAVLHSGLSLGEKYDEWRKIRNKEVKIVVGARSAIFAPFTNLGVIIIDEEHELTYKQDEMPKYHAVEIAKIRAKTYNATLVLGSATPSLESYARAIKKVYTLLELPKRATLTRLPKATIVNMTNEFKRGNLSIFSECLKEAITDRLNKHEQVILLLNRRGYENFLLCRSCGYTVMCQNCDISLTYHKTSKRLKCHYCGFEMPVVTECPKCKSKHIKGFGYGTQKVEEELIKTFPDARIIRMDVDTTSNKGDHDRIIKLFKEKQADILLGTQMIAKGLDFEDVTLVGVLLADISLRLPDFRASEKTFQLIMQVAGRAGRHKENSEVIIQTYNPEHYAIKLAAEHNYLAFFNQEMKVRKLGKYSPYYYLTKIIVQSEIFQDTLKEGNKIVNYLKSQLSNETVILGPVVPQVKRLNNLYSTQIIIKFKQESKLAESLEHILTSYQDSPINVIIDRYPTFIM